MPPLDPEPNDEEKQQQLDQDYDPPFSLPDDSQADDAADPQSLDPNLKDSQELYDEGLKGAGSSPSPSVQADEEGFDHEDEIS